MTDRPRLLNALLRLAVLRQAPQDDATLQIYLEEMEKEQVDVALVEQACEQLGLQPRVEFTAAFPALGTILIEMGQIDGDRRRAALRLTPPPPIPTEQEMLTFMQVWKESAKDDIRRELERLRATRETKAAANAADAIAHGETLSRDWWS